jgi:hypothetical protein
MGIEHGGVLAFEFLGKLSQSAVAFSKKPKSAATFHQGQEEHGLPKVTQPLKMIF